MDRGSVAFGCEAGVPSPSPQPSKESMLGSRGAHAEPGAVQPPLYLIYLASQIHLLGVRREIELSVQEVERAREARDAQGQVLF